MVRCCNNNKHDDFRVLKGLNRIIGLICLCVVSAFSESETLLTLLKTALNSNPMIIAAQSDVIVKEKAISAIPSLPDPTVSSGYFISPIETRVGPQRGKIGISQMIPWPGKTIQKKKAAGEKYAASQEALRKVEAKVLTDIRKLYSSYYATGREIEITKDNLEILKQMESVLLSQYTAAKISQIAVLKVQIEMAVLDDQLKSLDAEGVKIRQKLFPLVNDTLVNNLKFPEKLPQLKISTLVDSGITNIKKYNPSISKAQFMAAEASVEHELSRLKFAPDLMVMSDYFFTEKSSSSMIDPKENGKNPWNIGVSVSIPLWAGSKHAQIDKAKAMEKMRKAGLKNEIDIATAGVFTQFEDYRDAQRKSILYEKTLIPQAKQAVALGEENYVNGNVSVLDYLDAQRTLLKLTIVYEKQNARMESVAAEIDRLYGAVLTRQELW